jgi:hypothetical protein
VRGEIMNKISEEDRILFDSYHNKYKKDEKLQNAIKRYEEDHEVVLPENIRFVPGIDHVCVKIDGLPILRVSQPPVSNYSVSETKYTKQYLQPIEAVAI